MRERGGSSPSTGTTGNVVTRIYITKYGEMHMKAFIFALTLLSFTLVACGGSETETQTTDSTAVETPVAVDSVATVTNPVQ